MSTRTQQVIDGGLGAGLLSSPAWLQLLEQGLGFFVLAGGAALLVMRLILSWRELKRKKPETKEGDQ